MNISRVWIVLFVGLLFLIQVGIVEAAPAISIPDTTVKRGSFFTVDVHADDLLSGTAGSVTVVFHYNRTMLSVHSVTGGGQRIMQCDQPPFQAISLNPSSLGQLSISCNALSPAQSTLVSIEFEVLAGDSTVVHITPVEVSVDQVTINTVSFRPGTVTISSPPVKPSPQETLSQNFPNPFGGITDFNYTLSRTTSVDFSVFAITGQLVWRQSYPEQKEGLYTLKFDAGAQANFQMANGGYLLQMTTQNGVYRIPFFYIR